MRALSIEADQSPLVKVETGLGGEPFSFARIYCANEVYTWDRQPSCPLVQDRKIYIYKNDILRFLLEPIGCPCVGKFFPALALLEHLPSQHILLEQEQHQQMQ